MTKYQISGRIAEFNTTQHLMDNGYDILEINEVENGLPYDILARKDGIVYAIDVKSSINDKKMFMVNGNSIHRLLKISKELKAIPSFLLTDNKSFTMFTFRKI